jgi:hypothetical protein
VSTNGTSVFEQLTSKVREEYAKAAAANQDPPGRPTLIRKLAKPPEISTHLVRRAKELVDEELASPPPAAASEPPTDTSRAPAAIQQPACDEPDDRDLAATLDAGGDLPPITASPTPARHQPATRWARWIQRLRQQRWALILIGIGAGFSVWSGWVGLGQMTGYGPVQPLPGIWDGFTVNSAIVLPISVEAYGAYALKVWLSTRPRRKCARVYACASAFASLAVGGAAQVAYHLLKAYGYTRAPWQVVMAVALVPVVVLGLAAILAYLAKDVRQGGVQA